MMMMRRADSPKILLVSEWLFLFCEDFTFARFGLGGVELNVALPFFWHVIFMENCFDWALRHAGFAVNAFFGMDIEHLIALVEAFHGANHDAIGVFASRARLGDDMCHDLILFC
jgi:hypothetical protein